MRLMPLAGFTASLAAGVQRGQGALACRNSGALQVAARQLLELWTPEQLQHQVRGNGALACHTKSTNRGPA